MSEEDVGRRARIRKLGKGAAVAAAAALALYLGAVLLLHTLLDPDRLAGWAEPRMEAALNRDVELGTVELTVFPGLGVELRELSIAGPEGMEGPDVASLERLRLGIALLPLLRRQIRVDEASADGLDVRLVVAEDGRSNFGDLKPEGRDGAAEGADRESPLSLEIRDVRVEGGTASYRDRRTGRALVAADLSGGARLERVADGWRVGGRLEVAALRPRELPAARRWDGSSLALELEGRAGPEFRRLDVASGSATLGTVRLSVSGRVDSLRSSRRLLDLRVRAESLPVEDAMALAREPDGGAADDPADRARGTLDVDLRVEGALGPGERPAASGSASLRDGTLRGADGAVLAEGLEAEATLAPDSVVLRRLTGRLLGGALEGRGTLRLGDDRPFAGRVRAEPRLERWTKAAGPDSLDASGRIAIDAEVTGRLGALADTRVRGTVRPNGVVVRRPRWSGPVAVPGGSIALEGDRAKTSDLPVAVGADTLRVDARVAGLFSRLGGTDDRPEVDATARGDRLDLAVLFPRDREGGPSYGQLAFAHLGRRSLGGRSAAEIAGARSLSRPDPPPVRGEVRLAVGELLYGPWRLSDVRAVLSLGPDRLAIRDVGFGVLGGQASGELSLGVGAGARQPFSLDLETEGVAGGELLARVTPLGELLSGTTSLGISVAGSLDTLMLPATSDLEGEGRLTATDGRLRAFPVTEAVARRLSLPALRSPRFERLALPFRIRGDSLALPSSTFAADSFSIRMDGVVGLDARLDLSAGLELPRRVLSGLRLPEGGAGEALRELLRGDGGTGGLTLGIRGTTRQPRVDVAVARPAVTRPDGARETLEKKARGLLDRVLGGRKAPADTAAADSLPADSASSPPDRSGGG